MDASNRDDFRVRTGLDEVVLRRAPSKPGEQPTFVERVRHARTERVDQTARKPKAIEPIPTDHWTPPTVTARLRRMSAIYARMSFAPGIWPASFTCSMPEPVLNALSDYKPDPRRQRRMATSKELDLADRTLRSCLEVFKFRPEHKAAFWGVALGWSWRACAEEAHVWDKLCRELSHTAMGKLMAEVRQEIANEWNARMVPLQVEDIEFAQTFHKNRR